MGAAVYIYLNENPLLSHTVSHVQTIPSDHQASRRLWKPKRPVLRCEVNPWTPKNPTTLQQPYDFLLLVIWNLPIYQASGHNLNKITYLDGKNPEIANKFPDYSLGEIHRLGISLLGSVEPFNSSSRWSKFLRSPLVVFHIVAHLKKTPQKHQNPWVLWDKRQEVHGSPGQMLAYDLSLGCLWKNPLEKVSTWSFWKLPAGSKKHQHPKDPMKIDFESNIFFRSRLFICQDKLVLHPTKKNNNIWDIIFDGILFALCLNPEPHTLPDANSSPLNKDLPKKKKTIFQLPTFHPCFLLVFRKRYPPQKNISGDFSLISLVM